MTATKVIAGLVVAAAAAVTIVVFLNRDDAGPVIQMPAGDPGAGKLLTTASPCYLAAQRHDGKQCEEPKPAAADASRYDRESADLKRAVFDLELLQPEKAQKETDAALALDGNNAELRHLAARIAFTLYDVDRAEREIVVARRLKPHDPRIGTTYAEILIARRANREVVGVFDDVISNHPDYLFAREQRATFFTYLGQCCARGNYLVALEDLEYLIRHKAPDTGLLAKRAAILLVVGETKLAVADLSAALQLAPGRVDLLTERAQAYRRLGQDDLAVKDYDAVLADAAPDAPLYAMADGRRAKLLVRRAQSLVQLKRFADAARDAVAAMSVGGKAAILRAEILLRRHGFPDVPIDGENSARLRQALGACFGLKTCYQPVIQAI